MTQTPNIRRSGVPYIQSPPVRVPDVTRMYTKIDGQGTGPGVITRVQYDIKGRPQSDYTVT